MYIVTKGNDKREYEVNDSHEALLEFKREFGLSNLEGVNIRWFGGIDMPASTLWPRARNRTSDSHNSDVE